MRSAPRRSSARCGRRLNVSCRSVGRMGSSKGVTGAPAPSSEDFSTVASVADTTAAVAAPARGSSVLPGVHGRGGGRGRQNGEIVCATVRPRVRPRGHNIKPTKPTDTRKALGDNAPPFGIDTPTLRSSCPRQNLTGLHLRCL